MKKYLPHFYIFASLALFLFRIIGFLSQFGSVEHDSGWYLGVAANLAKRGIYASYTNTVTTDKIGPNPSLHGRFSVQDKNGFSYFPAGVTAGPGYVILEAIMLKFFGFGWWQYRIWPLFAFAGMLLLMFYFAFTLGGLLPLFIFQIWLWFNPHLYLQFSYEAYGEPVALFFLLLSYLFFFGFLKQEKKQKINAFFSGLFFSLAALTKYLSLLTAPAFIILLLFQAKTRFKKVITGFVCFFSGFILPLLSFEIYRYLYLLGHFGQQAWKATNRDFILHFRQNGSGLDFRHLDFNFINNKLSIWTEVGSGWFSWVLFLFSPLTTIFEKRKRINSLFFLVYFSALFSFLWYSFLSPAGWSRHIWHGLLLAMLLISLVFKYLFSPTRRFFLFSFFLLILWFFSFNPDRLFAGFNFNQQYLDQQYLKRYERGVQGFPSNPIFSLSDQQELVAFFQQNIKPEDKIYYLGWFLVAEASPLVDKNFFSLNRYLWLRGVNPEGGKSYLIFGPYQQGKYSLVQSSYLENKQNEYCQDLNFKNSSYALCELKNQVTFQNQAYE